MSREKQIDIIEELHIEDLLIDFDEMGFIPTTLHPTDPDAYAREWKDKLIEALKGYRKASDVARDIIDILKSAGIDEWRYPVIAELKKKYTQSLNEITEGEK